MTTREMLKGLLEFTALLTEQVSLDLTENHLSIKPEDFGNPGIWILGHIAINRANYLHYAKGDTERIPDGWASLFGRSSLVHEDLTLFPDPTNIRKFMKAEQAAALAYLETLSDQDLQQPPVISTATYKTIAEVFYATAVHESYHAGQFGLIRRLCGLSTLG